MSDRGFTFIHMNEREEKPRSRGITEIRGPYYTPMGKRYLDDVLETMGAYVDSLKFAGGSFTLMPPQALKEIIELAHRHNVLVSTGGFIEHVLTQGPEVVESSLVLAEQVPLRSLRLKAPATWSGPSGRPGASWRLEHT